MRILLPRSVIAVAAAACLVLSSAPAAQAAGLPATGTQPVEAVEPDPTPTPTPTLPPATAFRSPLAVKSYAVSSYYGARCIPLPGASTFHLGIDLAAPAGTPIYAIAAGRVTHTVSGTSSRVGYITMEHDIGGVIYQSRYLHMWTATTHVEVGDIVKAGQRISQVGTSGGSTGNHLHLEVWKGPWGSASAVEPSAFMKQQSVDLFAGAKAVTAKKTPSTCTYYATGSVNLRTGPSTSYDVIRLLAKGTKLTHVPGRVTSGFIPVTVGGLSGWVSSSYVSPHKPAASKPAAYVATASLNLRASPSTSAKRILVIPKGKSVGTIKEKKGVWWKVTYAGRTGWVHSGYLKKK